MSIEFEPVAGLVLPERLPELRAIAVERPDREIFIRADEEVPYGEVVRTMAAMFCFFFSR